MYDSRAYLQSKDFYLEHEKRSRARYKEELERENAHRNVYYEQAKTMNNNRAKYNKFIHESKEYLLTEALDTILNACLPRDIDHSLSKYGKSIVANFVHNEGADSLLNQFKTKSLLLSTVGYLVESVHKSVVNHCDVNDVESLLIRNSDLDKMMTKLQTVSSEEFTQTIVDRVSAAEVEFVNANRKTKTELEELAQKTQEKIDNVKEKDIEVENEIKQEFARMYKSQANELQHRKKNILEAMIFRTSMNITADDQLRMNFISESGKLDMNRIINTAEVMYTFLEMVNTLNIKSVNEKYIETLLNSIK